MPSIPLLTICTITPDGKQPFLEAFQRALATPNTPARTAYWLGKIAKVLHAEVKEFTEVRAKLVSSLGTPVEGEPGQFSISPENIVKFQEEIASLDRGVELPVPADLKLALPPSITPEDWLPFMAVVDLFEEPK